MRTTEQYIWVIAYINVKHIDRIQRELDKSNQYKGIEFHVPTVQVLKKQFKGKDHFNAVPLLFNYGFFKIPLLWAMNVDLLNKIRTDISCISGWVPDPARSRVKPSRFIEEDDEYIYQTDNQEYHDLIRPVLCATASEAEIRAMIKVADETSIHSSEEINRLQPGSIVTLMCYPFEGIRALVESIDLRSKKIVVILEMSVDDEDEEGDTFTGMPVTVSFDNVFYSIYQGSHDEGYNQDKTLTDVQIKTAGI